MFTLVRDLLEVFAMLENPKPAANENMVQLPLPGEILYFYDPSTGAVGLKAIRKCPAEWGPTPRTAPVAGSTSTTPRPMAVTASSVTMGASYRTK